jgi:hypothetical protein
MFDIATFIPKRIEWNVIGGTTWVVFGTLHAAKRQVFKPTQYGGMGFTFVEKFNANA